MMSVPWLQICNGSLTSGCHSNGMKVQNQHTTTPPSFEKNAFWIQNAFKSAILQVLSWSIVHLVDPSVNNSLIFCTTFVLHICKSSSSSICPTKLWNEAYTSCQLKTGIGANTDAPLMHLWCTPDAPLMHPWCTFGAKFCTFDAPLMHLWCTFDAKLMAFSGNITATLQQLHGTFRQLCGTFLLPFVNNTATLWHLS